MAEKADITERNKEIVKLRTRAKDPLTIRAIAEKFGISVSAVHAVLRAAGATEIQVLTAKDKELGRKVAKPAKKAPAAKKEPRKAAAKKAASGAKKGPRKEALGDALASANSVKEAQAAKGAKAPAVAAPPPA